jgi:hypothetical protein
LARKNLLILESQPHPIFLLHFDDVDQNNSQVGNSANFRSVLFGAACAGDLHRGGNQKSSYHHPLDLERDLPRVIGC